jgi:hypothetical protein
MLRYCYIPIVCTSEVTCASKLKCNAQKSATKLAVLQLHIEHEQFQTGPLSSLTALHTTLIFIHYYSPVDIIEGRYRNTHWLHCASLSLALLLKQGILISFLLYHFELYSYRRTGTGNHLNGNV